ncbi:MAG: primosomal protein N', partial [Bacteroidota bacterium]
SYKQDSPNPRYNARDVAVMRGKIENAIVVLGSATPSIESMHNAHSGKYKLLELTERADNAKMPSVQIVNMFEEKKKSLVHGTLSIVLINAIIERLKKKEGVILFQNRRGFSSYLECQDCGNIPQCRHCAVSLTYHKAKGQLRCHYCGYTINMPQVCPACKNHHLGVVGFGTQRIEDELNEYFQKMGITAKIARMDLDTTSKKGSHRRLLHSFASGEVDILLGTQMVAKGLDFERVTLVGVINADMQLFLPDFRASERTYQLLTQVSGRAGRHSDKPGEVYIQTNHPYSPAIQSALLASYSDFFNYEIVQRKNAFYPPFSRFNIIELSGKELTDVIRNAKYFAELLPQNSKYMTVLGPVEPVIPRIRTYYRRIIVIKNSKTSDAKGAKLRAALKTALEKYYAKYPSGDVRLTVDIDSYSGL